MGGDIQSSIAPARAGTEKYLFNLQLSPLFAVPISVEICALQVYFIAYAMENEKDYETKITPLEGLRLSDSQKKDKEETEQEKIHAQPSSKMPLLFRILPRGLWYTA